MAKFPDTKSAVIAGIRSSHDRQAWESFVSMYRPVIYRLARRKGLQDADALDLVQQVFVAVAGAIGRWEQSENTRFRNWLSKVTKNAVLNALSRKPRDVSAGGSELRDLLHEHPDGDESREGEFELEARREVYHRAAAIVQTKVRGNSWQAFQLTIVEGQPVTDVAKKLGITIGGVYAAQGRVMARLQNVVAEIEEEE